MMGVEGGGGRGAQSPVLDRELVCSSAPNPARATLLGEIGDFVVLSEHHLGRLHGRPLGKIFLVE